AQVAGVAVVLLEWLTEVLDERLVPAKGRASIAEHVLKVENCFRYERRVDRLFRFSGGPLDDPLPGQEVGGGREQDAFGFQPVTAGPAGLLLVVFDRLRHRRMQDESQV